MGNAVGWGSAVDGYSYFLILNMIGMLPKLVITDIDGVWTDGGMYYTAEGDVMKRFFRERWLGSDFSARIGYTCGYYDR